MHLCLLLVFFFLFFLSQRQWSAGHLETKKKEKSPCVLCVCVLKSRSVGERESHNYYEKKAVYLLFETLIMGSGRLENVYSHCGEIAPKQDQQAMKLPQKQCEAGLTGCESPPRCFCLQESWASRNIHYLSHQDSGSEKKKKKKDTKYSHAMLYSTQRGQLSASIVRQLSVICPASSFRPLTRRLMIDSLRVLNEGGDG